ncbi:MAG: glycosyltransferase family 9 protein [Candidatus Wallbacteria bacterium]|nr:glycosyltransferase family 9 protein [Candidatus Wallbacteria bacterium]
MKFLIPFYLGIGNAVMFTPFLSTLRNKFPDASIHLIGGLPWEPEKILPAELFDEFHFLPKTAPFSGIMNMLSELPDLDVYFHPYQGSNYKFLMLLRILRPRVTVIGHAGLPGFRGICNRLLLSRGYSWKSGVHESRKYLNLLSGLQISDKEFISVPKIRSVPSILAPGYIVIHPGTTCNQESPKKYPLEHWLLVLKMLKESGRQLVLVGDRTELELGNRLTAGCDFPVRNLIGQTTVSQLSGVLGSASLVLGADSGIAHMAGAQNVPLIVLWGPTDFSLSHPLGDKVHFLKKDFPCAPCTSAFRRSEKNAHRRCPESPCMNSISPQEIVDLALEILK